MEVQYRAYQELLQYINLSKIDTEDNDPSKGSTNEHVFPSDQFSFAFLALARTCASTTSHDLMFALRKHPPHVPSFISIFIACRICVFILMEVTYLS